MDTIKASVTGGPLSLNTLNQIKRDILASVNPWPENRIIVSRDTRNRIVLDLAKYDGIPIRGRRGTRTVRFRRDRWKVAGQ